MYDHSAYVWIKFSITLNQAFRVAKGQCPHMHKVERALCVSLLQLSPAGVRGRASGRASISALRVSKNSYESSRLVPHDEQPALAHSERKRIVKMTSVKGRLVNSSLAFLSNSRHHRGGNVYCPMLSRLHFEHRRRHALDRALSTLRAAFPRCRWSTNKHWRSYAEMYFISS